MSSRALTFSRIRLKADTTELIAAMFVMAIATAAPLAGQAPSTAKAKPTAAKTLAPPKLAEPAKAGHPDLQGTWTNPTITPFERPADLAGKQFLTDQEAAELEKRVAKQRLDADGPPPKGSVGNYNQFWFGAGTKVVSTMQTSLVVDPPDGRVPLKRTAEERRDAYLKRSTESPEFMSVWDRFYEYACHEGNHAVEGILKGARLEEREAAAANTRQK